MITTLRGIDYADGAALNRNLERAAERHRQIREEAERSAPPPVDPTASLESDPAADAQKPGGIREHLHEMFG